MMGVCCDSRDDRAFLTPCAPAGEVGLYISLHLILHRACDVLLHHIGTKIPEGTGQRAIRHTVLDI